jgi:hypothetical protein
MNNIQPGLTQILFSFESLLGLVAEEPGMPHFVSVVLLPHMVVDIIQWTQEKIYSDKVPTYRLTVQYTLRLLSETHDLCKFLNRRAKKYR